MSIVGRFTTAAALALAATTLGPGALGAQETTEPDSAAMTEERAERREAKAEERAERRAEMTDEERAERRAGNRAEMTDEERAERQGRRDGMSEGDREAKRDERARRGGESGRQRGERPAVGPRRSFESRWEARLQERDDLDAEGARALAVDMLTSFWERGSDRIDSTLSSGDVSVACGSHAAAYRAEQARLEQTLARGGSADLGAVRSSFAAMSASLSGCAEGAPDRASLSAEERDARRAARDRGDTADRGQRGERPDADPGRMLRRQAGMLEMLAERSRVMEESISEHFGG